MFTSNTKLSLYLETISKTWVVIWAKMSSVTWISSIAHWECGLGEARKRYRTRVKFPTLFLLGRWLRASHSHLLNRVIIPISQSCQGWKEIKSTFKSHSAIQVWIISVNFIVYLSWIWICVSRKCNSRRSSTSALFLYKINILYVFLLFCVCL